MRGARNYPRRGPRWPWPSALRVLSPRGECARDRLSQVREGKPGALQVLSWLRRRIAARSEEGRGPEAASQHRARRGSDGSGCTRAVALRSQHAARGHAARRHCAGWQRARRGHWIDARRDAGRRCRSGHSCTVSRRASDRGTGTQRWPVTRGGDARATSCAGRAAGASLPCLLESRSRGFQVLRNVRPSHQSRRCGGCGFTGDGRAAGCGGACAQPDARGERSGRGAARQARADQPRRI